MRRFFGLLLFLLYLLVLLRLTVFRNGCFSHGLFTGRIVWVPFLYLAELVRRGDWWYFTYLFVGNLVWFMPFGFFLRLFGQPFGRTLLLGFLLSLCIETAQFVLGCGVTEVEDLILNSIGTLIGCLFSLPFLKQKP